MTNFSDSILNLPRYSKRIIAIITDVILCIICTWLAFIIRLDEVILFRDFNFYPALISVLLALPIFWLFGLYQTIFRFTGLSITFNILISTTVYGLLYFFVIAIYSLPGVPRSIGVIQPMVLFFSIISSRLLFKYLLSYNIKYKKISNKTNVLIYGAGQFGRNIAIALQNSLQLNVRGFLDDNENLHKQTILGLKIYSPSHLKSLIEIKNITLVLLAMPTIGRVKRNQIINFINDYKLIVKTLPSISEIIDGRVTLSDIKDLNIEDLLNRDEVKPDKHLISMNIEFKNILVTGAGGSIGSELCRQIIKLNPKTLLLIELSEYALYKIQDELQNYNRSIKIIPILMNSQNQNMLEKIIEIFEIDTIYHSAAYKHVPLVEENICEGVKNNVFSTIAIANAAVSKKVSNLVLISSDKAVRSTNVMGASKRLSELYLQGLYKNIKNIKTNFSIVRFGNVLESSGSVIPKFREQIKQGGPVTLTHKDVTRYFMTVTEAAQLVIQAGAMGKKSEVFVLDMGNSIKIIDLIYKMIALSGLSVKDINNPNGDIEIKTIGLRPGEKLYEELLIGDNPVNTIHPKILMIEEDYIPFEKLEIDLKKLKTLIENNEAEAVRGFLKTIIKSFNVNSEIVDYYYVKKKSQTSLLN